MKFDYPVINADILIIGGGSAGSMAAIRAKELNPKQEVVVFEKGSMKYSGSIARGMDALNIVAVPGISDPKTYVEAMEIVTEGIFDVPVSYTLADRSWELMKKLESWGVCFPTDKTGNYDLLKGHPKGRFIMTMKEPELKTKLHKRCQELGVRIINRTMAVRLLKTGNDVTGAIGINVRSGEIIVCQAKAVIMCNGGTARFGLPANGNLYGIYDFPGNTGDGYCLALNAGAELSGFEYTVTYYIVKDINAPLLFITLTRGAQLYNALGEAFHKGHPGMMTMIDEHNAGRGPMRIRMGHLAEDTIQEIEELLFTTERPACERFYQGRNIDFRSGEIELSPTEIFLCGGHGLTGIRIDEKGQSSMPGLYAAGDTALCVRGHLSGAFVYGEVAAEFGTERASVTNHGELDGSQVDEFLKDKTAKLNQSDGKVPIEEFEFKVRRIITDYLTPPKNEYKLDRALLWMDRFNEEFTHIPRIKNIHDLFKAYEVENIIQCAKLNAVASKERKESRWGFWHQRTDYQDRDDLNWRKHIILTKDAKSNEINVTHKEVIR
jgi:succinate dehydrogenase/fumarate reductase flavoprotein subunit